MSIALILALVACGGGTAAGLPAALPDQAVEAGKIAREIQADPSKRADVLAAHGVTEDAFRVALFDIAADEAATKAYEAERTR